ncbi:hypothetical protein [Nocardia pseudovaccinii]|uniref:hypothetical protein n=1 Tax=Nocardia pseudovaccinii TaxID=189540 RepID=UPI0007A382DB|nr:hypothetical protein [Nocardia pseudovaccinii]
MTAASSNKDSAVIRALYRDRAHPIALLTTVYPAVRAYNDPKEPTRSVLYMATPEGLITYHIDEADLDLFAHVELIQDHHDHRVQWDRAGKDVVHQRFQRLITRAVADAAAIRRLQDLAHAHELDPAVLVGVVDDHQLHELSEMHNAGFTAQIPYLYARIGEAALAQLLVEAVTAGAA